MKYYEIQVTLEIEAPEYDDFSNDSYTLEVGYHGEYGIYDLGQNSEATGLLECFRRIAEEKANEIRDRWGEKREEE